MSGDNEIGYRKPPKQYRFKKGISGNPKGRPKKKPSGMGDFVEKVVREEVVYLDEGKRKRTSQSELHARALVKQALAGDLPAMKQIFKEVKQSQAVGEVTTIFVSGGLPNRFAEEDESNAMTTDAFADGPDRKKGRERR